MTENSTKIELPIAVATEMLAALKAVEDLFKCSNYSDMLSGVSVLQESGQITSAVNNAEGFVGEAIARAEAAALDMLEALNFVSMTAGPDFHPEALDKVRRAIAKAEGRLIEWREHPHGLSDVPVAVSKAGVA